MNFEWIDFYTEFATKLLEFKDNREKLIHKIYSIYDNIGISVPKLEKDNEITDIDPFTVFGLFNKGITNNNRILILNGIASEFQIFANVPDNFDGVPVLNNLKATFYSFIDERNDSDIDNIWGLFEAAINFSESDTKENLEKFIEYYNIVHEQRCIKWNITIGLYWIRPYTFINLDSRNRWYMIDTNNMPDEFVTAINKKLNKVPYAEEYLEIRDICRKTFESAECKYKSFPELSYYAWIESERVNKELKSEDKKASKAYFLRWFKPLIQALRDLGGSGTPAQARQKIAENEKLTDEEISIKRGKNNANKFENEVAFARSYLVKTGYIDKSVYGIWTLTDAGKNVEMTDELASEIFKNVVADTQKRRKDDENTFSDSDVDTVHYWLYNPGQGAEKWKECCDREVMLLGWGKIGDLEIFNTKDEIKQQLKQVYGNESSYINLSNTLWQFAHDIKIGDIIFVKKGNSSVIGKGIVESDYSYDSDCDSEYRNVKKINWINEGLWSVQQKLPQKMLADITPYTDLVQELDSLFENIDDEDEKEIVYPEYTRKDFLKDVYMSEEDYNRLTGVLCNKKNIILQGAPGVGKTYVAKRLAYSIMGVKDVERVKMVQFHQSYSYEDFIMGFRPTLSGFELKKGAFYNFCKKAEIDSDNDYFFIIDEINRGNLSKIFGELFMLIEKDKRGSELQLLYSDEKFAVPKNVYIIGMMNTADRSLAMLDYALRRRFAFFDIKPGFDTEGFIEYKKSINNEKFDKLINCVQNLNNSILADESLGEGFCIGHSYFCNLKQEDVNEQWLYGIVEYELIPLLKEYWFDESGKVHDWSERLRSAIR